MNILVTGSKGQLGSELHNIVKTGKAEIGPISKGYKDCNFIWTDIETLDICKLENVKRFCCTNQVDIIILLHSY